ncbi:hypothetical protein [Streptomyces sp. NPDC058623]|uniref:hypothetical protein n=1 Tax=Streptomyces sp. NPDC058623 TaxID=3346563 RepID=UPI00364A66DF
MSDFDAKARRARVRLIAIGVALGVAVTVGVVATVGAIDSDAKPPTGSPPVAASTPGKGTETAPEQVEIFTPATAKTVTLVRPTTHTDGIGRGFKHTFHSSNAAAASYWQDISFLDDVTARKQWEAVVSKDSPGTVDAQISRIRQLRESVGLPPSGAVPTGIEFTKVVKALRAVPVPGTDAEVVEVTMIYDIYGIEPNKGADKSPLRDQRVELIVKWENGDWKVTEEEKYRGAARVATVFDPNSNEAFLDGWRMVNFA